MYIITISFSTVKLKSGPNFSQFIYWFKYSLNVALAGLLNFSQFKEKKGILSNCYQFTKELGNWDFWSLRYLSDCENRLSDIVCLQERERGEPNLKLHYQFSRKRNVHAHRLEPPLHPPSLFKGGEVNFKYFPWRGGIWKIKKGGVSMVQGQVFLKGESGTFPI